MKNLLKFQFVIKKKKKKSSSKKRKIKKPIIILGICLILCLINLFQNNNINTLMGIHSSSGYMIYYYNNINNQLQYSTSKNNNTTTTTSTSTKSSSSHDDYPFAFGACLLIKDDNQIIPEWLAYHYTVLPLRYLIVAVDPLSLTDPRPIFDLFVKNLPDLYIEVWTDQKRYWYDNKYAKLNEFNPLNYTSQQQGSFYIARQFSFYTNCLRHLYRNFSSVGTSINTNNNDNNNAHNNAHNNVDNNNKRKYDLQWVVLSDTDEYITYNGRFASEGDPNNKDIGYRRSNVPKKIGKQNETFAHYITNTPYFQEETTNTICRVFPRINFLAIPEVNDTQIQHYLPPKPKQPPGSNNNDDDDITTTSTTSPTIDGKMFHTLRYQSHGWLAYRKFPGKSLIKLENYNPRLQVLNPHRPFAGSCDNSVFGSVVDKEAYFRFHHYTGSLETFVSRPERLESGWYERNKATTEGNDDSLSNWFIEFTKLLDDDYNLAYKLTQQLRQSAYDESMKIKHRIEINKERIYPIFDW